MKKNSASVIVIAVIVLAVLALVIMVGVALFKPSPDTQQHESGEIPTYEVISVDISSAVSLSWSSDGVEYNLTKTENGWVWEEDPEFPVSTEKVEKLCSVLKNLRAPTIFNGVSESRRKGYGLNDESARRIVLKNSTGEHVLMVGNLNTIRNQYYVMVPSNPNTVYLVEADTLVGFNESAEDLIRVDPLDRVTSAMLKGFELRYNGDLYEFQYEVRNDGSSDVTPWTFSFNGGESLSYPDPSGFLTAMFSALQYSSLVSWKQSNLSSYLSEEDSPLQLTVFYSKTVKTEDGTQEKQDFSYSLRFCGMNERDYDYVNPTDTAFVYTLNLHNIFDSFEEIMENCQQLLSPTP